MSPLEQELRRVVAAAGASWSQADIELATRIGIDVTQLLARQAAGEDVHQELAIAKAAAQNIAAGSAVAAGKAISDAILKSLGRTLRAFAEFM